MPKLRQPKTEFVDRMMMMMLLLETVSQQIFLYKPPNDVCLFSVDFRSIPYRTDTNPSLIFITFSRNA